MKIASVEAIPLSIPFTFGGQSFGFGGSDWLALTTLLVRVETDDGLVGWGDAFSYNCIGAVKAAVEDMVAPLVIGRDPSDVEAINHDLQQGLHLFGRYGVTLFAISGLDIALWDLRGKVQAKGLSDLLGGARRDQLPAYASLFRYGEEAPLLARCEMALSEGYEIIKLHEVREPLVAATRALVGPDIPITLDCNCPWTPKEALEQAKALQPHNLLWLEEPIFPPEDFKAIARLQEDSGLRIAAGENACTHQEFEKMFYAEAVTFAQPSVTKVGGITEFIKVVALAEQSGVAVMPHSPYFGPGFLATLHLAAALAPEGLIERFHLNMEASLYGDLINPSQEGSFSLPIGPGLGQDPDPEVIKAFRMA